MSAVLGEALDGILAQTYQLVEIIVSDVVQLMARPIVGTQVGGLPEVVVPQEAGLLVEPEDSAGLAEAIAFLLEHPRTAVEMGQAGRRRVQEVFNWQRCVDRYDELYKQLMGHGPMLHAQSVV